VTTTFRVDFRAGLYSVLTTYQAANPTLLSSIHDYPPESYATPCAYVEKTVNERVEHNAGLRYRVVTGTVVLLTKLISNAQATHEQDVLVDGLMDAFSAGFHAASGSSLTQPVSVTDTEVPGGEGVRYAAAIFTVEGSIQEGRP